MNTLSTKHFGFCLFLGVLIALWPSPMRAADDEVQRLAAENQQLRAQIAELTAELEALRGELAALRENNDELTHETQVLQEQSAELRGKAEAAASAVQDHAMAAQAQRIQTAYDEKADRTTVTFGPEPLEAEGNAGEFYFSMVYGHDGGGRVAVESVKLFLQNYRSGRLFDEQSEVAFEVDGEPVALAITGFDLTPRRGGLPGRARSDRSDEVVELTLNRVELKQLGEARSLMYRQDRAVVVFDQEDLAAMRAVAARMAGE